MSRIIFVQDNVCTGWFLYRIIFVQDNVCPGWCLYRRMFVQEDICPRGCLYRMMFVHDDVCPGWCLFENSAKHCKNFLGTPLKYFWNFPEIPFEVTSNTLEIQFNLPWNPFGTILKYPCNFLQTLETSLKLLWNFLKHH